MGNQNLKIGQVVFFISDESDKIIPALVSEEILVKTLKGDSVHWKLLVGPPDKRKTVSSQAIESTLFSSLDEVRDHMKRNFDSFLEQITGSTKQYIKKWYSQDIDVNHHTGERSMDDYLDSVSESNEEHEEFEEVSPKRLSLAPDLDKEEMRERIRSMVAGSSEEDYQQENKNPQTKEKDFVELPDGTKVPITVSL